MKRPFSLKIARQKAEDLLHELGITTLPIDPFSIARNYDIIVQPKPDTADGVSGMLLRHGNTFGILYATHITSQGFQRFSVAHELGHYFLDGHMDHIFSDEGIHVSRAGFVSGDLYELEADHFAAGLLMPAVLFRRELSRLDFDLSSIESLAHSCQTSLTATAIRCAELTDDAIAVIVSTGSQVDYCFLSETMKSLPEITWLKNGSPVPSNTATVKFNADAHLVESADKVTTEIDIMDWLGGTRSVSASEEVVGLGSYGKTLTILTCPSLADETYQDEDDNEDDLIERWTPRFRR